MTSPADHEPERPGAHGARPPGTFAATTGAALRTLARPVRLVVTALVIVLALALGIPWLINLVW